MMLLEVYYTIRFLKWQIYLVFLKKAKQESKKKARRKQKDFLTLYIGCHFRVIPGSGVVLPGSSRKCMPPVLYLV